MTMNAYEETCFKNAVKFVAVRGSKPSTRIKHEFEEFGDALKFGASFGVRRTMIYAITEMGNIAHICNA